MANFQGIELARVVALTPTPEFIDTIGYPADSPGSKPGDLYNPRYRGEVGFMTLEQARISQALGDVLVLVDHTPLDVVEAILNDPVILDITTLPEWETWPVAGLGSKWGLDTGVYVIHGPSDAVRQPIVYQDIDIENVEVFTTLLSHFTSATQADHILALRIKDADNYISAHYHGTGVRIGQVVGGGSNTLISVDRPVTPALLQLRAIGNQLEAFLADSKIGEFEIDPALLGPGRIGIVARRNQTEVPRGIMRSWGYRLPTQVDLPAPGEEVWEKVKAGIGTLTLTLIVTPPDPEIEVRVNEGDWYRSNQPGETVQTVVIPNLSAIGPETYVAEVRSRNSRYFTDPAYSVTYTSPDYREALTLTPSHVWAKSGSARSWLTVTVNTDPSAAATEARLDDGAWRSRDGGTDIDRSWTYGPLQTRGTEEYVFENQTAQLEYTGSILERIDAPDHRDEATFSDVTWEWSDGGFNTVNLQLSCTVDLSVPGYQASFQGGDWETSDSAPGSRRIWNYTGLAPNTEYTVNFRVDPTYLDYKGSSGPHSDTSPDYGYEQLVLTPGTEATWESVSPSLANAEVTCSVDTESPVTIEAKSDFGDWVKSDREFGSTRTFTIPNLSAAGGEVHNVTFRVNDPDYSSNEPVQAYTAPDLSIMQTVLTARPTNWSYASNGFGDLHVSVEVSHVHTMRVDVRRDNGSWVRMTEWSGAVRNYTFESVPAEGGTSLIEYRANKPEEFYAPEVQQTDFVPDYRHHNNGVFYPPTMWVARSYGSTNLSGVMATETIPPSVQETRTFRWYCNELGAAEHRLDLALTLRSADGKFDLEKEYQWFVKFEGETPYFTYDPEQTGSEKDQPLTDPWFKLGPTGGFSYNGPPEERWVECQVTFGTIPHMNDLIFDYTLEIK